MEKLMFKVVLLVMLLILVLGFILPTIVSYKDTLVVVAGSVVVITITYFIGRVLTKSIIKQLNKINNEEH